jgi:predicted nuclease with TOPRIM domain
MGRAGKISVTAITAGKEREVIKMRLMNRAALPLLIISLAIALAGCGVSKDKYESLLNEKIALEEKVSVLTKARDALKNEYDLLLKEKMDLATKLETVNNEKNALKSEYDKLLDEKIALKAAYDKLQAENKTLQNKLVRR